MFFTAADVVAEGWWIVANGWWELAHSRHSMLGTRGDSPNISSGVLKVFVK